MRDQDSFNLRPVYLDSVRLQLHAFICFLCADMVDCSVQADKGIQNRTLNFKYQLLETVDK